MGFVMVDNEGWLNASIGDFNIIAGAPRFLEGNRNPDIIVVTLDDLIGDKQIVLGMYEDRREAISDLLGLAQQIVIQLESWQTREWALTQTITGSK